MKAMHEGTARPGPAQEDEIQSIVARMREVPEIREILDHPQFRRLAEFRHHGRVTCLGHCLRVGALAFIRAEKRGLDAVSAARGALLHDFFFYDWRTGGPRLHGFRHPAIACDNAGKLFALNAVERDAILRHMWPLTVIPPRFPESRIVSYADKQATWRDYRNSLRRRLLRKKILSKKR